MDGTFAKDTNADDRRVLNWSAEQEGWLIQQAYEGMLRAVEEDRDGRRHVIHGKMAIAELAEAAMGRICRALGGGPSRSPLTELKRVAGIEEDPYGRSR